MTAKIEKSEDTWREELTPPSTRSSAARAPSRRSPAVRPTEDDGIYRCAACSTELFLLRHQVRLGAGWPSFTDPAAHENIELHEDRSLFMKRTEVTCAVCGGHLGHVFDDGPGESGQRFCINSAALELDKQAGA